MTPPVPLVFFVGGALFGWLARGWQQRAARARHVAEAAEHARLARMREEGCSPLLQWQLRALWDQHLALRLCLECRPEVAGAELPDGRLWWGSREGFQREEARVLTAQRLADIDALIAARAARAPSSVAETPAAPWPLL
jgi:hypothetical protein